MVTWFFLLSIVSLIAVTAIYLSNICKPWPMRFYQPLLRRLYSTARPLKRATHSTLLLLGVVLIFVAVTAFTFSSLPSNTITLPLEVYAPNGFDATNGSQAAPFGDETVTINIADVNAVNDLAFWMHQPYYHLGGGSTFDEQEGFDNEGAVAISINGGPFVDIRDNNTKCAFPEGQMGPYDNNPSSDNQGRTADNCIGGPTPSPRFSVDKNFSGGLVTGNNSITFRYNGSKGIRSGYRVLYIAALGGATTIQNVDWLSGGLLAGGTTTFQSDDPTTWTAPSGGDASNGEALFTTRNILKGHVRQANPSMPGEDIVAACSDCHAKDGSDLWYFNYSNETIIARSRMHGLTEQQGKDIAAYIRSIEMQDREGRYYEAPGRPWNPPFQPGPTYGLNNEVNAWDELTDDESHVWAAGAGLDDYLNDPLDEGKYLFAAGGDPGNGIPPTGFATFRDPSTGRQELVWQKFALGTHDDIDLKKYPLAIQFPDWNTWLPDISPVGDIPGGDIRTYNGWYDKYEYYVGNGNSASWAGNGVDGKNPDDPGGLSEILKRFRALYNKSKNFRTNVTGKGATSAIDAKKDLSIAQFNMVKVWEIYQHFDLYDHADKVIGDAKFSNDELYSDWNLDIGMPVRSRHFFDLAPHIIGDNRQSSDHFHWGSFLGQKWASHIWYQMQVTLDPGIHPSYHGGGPVDWQYQDSHMSEFTRHADIDASYREFASQMRRFQQSYTSGIGVCPECEGVSGKEGRALWSKHSQPVWALDAFNTGGETRPSGVFNGVFIKISDADLQRLVTAWLRAWWDGYKREPISDFQQRQCTNNGWCWEPSSHVPDPDGSTYHAKYKADRFYQKLKTSADAGVAAGVIDSIATQWASPMWPEANQNNYSANGLPYSWEDVAEVEPDDTEAPSVPQSVTASASSPTAVDLSWEASSDNVGVTSYEVRRGGEVVATTEATSYADTGLSPETSYTYTVEAFDAAGNGSGTSEEASVTTPASSPPPATDGLIAYWQLDQSSGTTAPDASGSFDGTLANGPSWSPDGGQAGGALAFDGDDDHVDLGAPDVSGEALTIALWMKADDFGVEDARFLSKATGTNPEAHYWMVGTKNQTRIRFRLKTGGSTTTLESAEGVLTSGQWHHVAAVYDGGQMRIYRDGEQVASADKNGAIDTDGSVAAALGNNPGGERPFDGLLDEVRLYDRALSATEISTLMTGGEQNVSQVIALNQGWNIVSTRLAPDLPALESVFEAVPEVNLVKDAAGDAYIPSEDINEIGDWEVFEAYMVHSTDNVSLTIEGQSVDPGSPIALTSGWNIVPFLPENTMPIAEALSSILGQFVIVKDGMGQAYIPAYSIDEIGDLQPGRGYKIFVTSNTELTYPSVDETTLTMTSRE
jgi:chitodextrinase/cytochrome c553